MLTLIWSLLLLLSRFSRVRLCATPETATHQASHTWDSPGKNTGVGCHFLLQCMKVESESEAAQSFPTLSDPMDYSLPGSSVHGFSRQEYWSGVPLPSPYVEVGSFYIHFLESFFLNHKWVLNFAKSFFWTYWDNLMVLYSSICWCGVSNCACWRIFAFLG